MEALKKLLIAECDYHMSDETMDRLLGEMTEVHLKNKEPLISYGKCDSNVYVVRSGLLRYACFNGTKEMTFGFATPGTLMISYHSFYHNAPSFFQFESCGESVVMKLTKEKFDEMFRDIVDFKDWMFRMSTLQLYAYEMKIALISGTAKERFEGLIKNRPEILNKVSDKVLASYIGINQPYFSRLKRQILSNK